MPEEISNTIQSRTANDGSLNAYICICCHCACSETGPAPPACTEDRLMESGATSQTWRSTPNSAFVDSNLAAATSEPSFRASCTWLQDPLDIPLKRKRVC